MLDILEDFCHMRSHQYCRLDGTTSLEDRQERVSTYTNRERDTSNNASILCGSFLMFSESTKNYEVTQVAHTTVNGLVKASSFYENILW